MGAQNPAQLDLAAEDALRLHVLLAGEVLAVRIDEGVPALHALTSRGEARIALHPNCRLEAYLTRVREVLGGHALGSPGGYPVHLRRWTRMGQATPKSLASLLLLGEPEAVVAVAHAPGLTDELARRAWWALPTMEVARSMLAQAAVRQGGTGPVLADFLVEHLAFEEDPVAALNCVRAVLAAGLLDAGRRRELWQKARRRPYYYLGFLEAIPDGLPEEAPPRPLPAAVAARAAAGEPLAVLLRRCYAAGGQSFLKAAELALDKPGTHEAVYGLLDVLGGYFAAAAAADPLGLPELPAEAAALQVLARCSNRDAEAILTRTTAVGPLLRQKIEPLVAPLLGHLRLLRGQA